VSLEHILQAIAISGEADVAEIEARTCAEVKEILANAHQEAVRVKAKAFNKAVAPAAHERSRILHQAKLEALKATGGLRETLVDAALEGARNYLASFRAEADYREVLFRLTQEALAATRVSSGENMTICLEIDPRDRAMLEDILDEMKLNVLVLEVLESWGGLVTRSEDGRVVVINTLEARLERIIPDLRRHLPGLFEDQECQTLTTAMPAYTP
jgi:vacuolar-type H+-ATPase subunit E/Vma4